MSIRFNLVQLRAFVAAAETRNFTEAADRVHVAQPTFSATIRGLEEHIGARLFERNSRNVRLTQVGSEFLPLARRVLDDVDRAAALMSDLVSVRRGGVRFSALPVLYAYQLQSALKMFRLENPGIRLDLSEYQTSDAMDQLRREQIDLAVVTELTEEKDIGYTKLCDRSMVAVMRQDHPLAQYESVVWKSLLEAPIVALQGGGPMGSYVEQVLAAHGIQISPEYQVEQIHTAIGIVMAGLGICITSSVTAPAMCKGVPLVSKEVTQPRLVRSFSLAQLAGRELPPAAEKLRLSILRHWDGVGVAPTLP